MAITTPQKDWQAGAILTAADLDAYLSANIAGILAGLMPSGVVRLTLPAQVFRATAGSPTEALVGSGGGVLEMDAWAMDAASDEAVMTQWEMPFDPAAGTVTAKVLWAPTTTNTGTVAWQLMVSDIADGEQIDQAVDETETFTPQAGSGTAENLHTTAAVTLNRTGRFWRIVVYRNADDAGNDTYTGDASFIGLRIEFTPT